MESLAKSTNSPLLLPTKPRSLWRGGQGAGKGYSLQRRKSALRGRAGAGGVGGSGPASKENVGDATAIAIPLFTKDLPDSVQFVKHDSFFCHSAVLLGRITFYGADEYRACGLRKEQSWRRFLLVVVRMRFVGSGRPWQRERRKTLLNGAALPTLPHGEAGRGEEVHRARVGHRAEGLVGGRKRGLPAALRSAGAAGCIPDAASERGALLSDAAEPIAAARARVVQRGPAERPHAAGCRARGGGWPLPGASGSEGKMRFSFSPRCSWSCTRLPRANPMKGDSECD